NGVQWLLKNHHDLIGDAELCLNEGGWGESLNGKKISNDVQVSEKYVINYRLEIHNKGGHSSMPVPDNAIYHLSGALVRLSEFGFPLKLNEVTRAYFNAMSKIETGAISADLAQAAAGSQPAMQKVAAANPAWNSTLRTTCVATQIEGGHAKNALPQLAAANVNCRVLPEDSIEYVTNSLRTVFADPQVDISVAGEVVKGPASPLNPQLMQTVSRITNQLWPGVPTVPIMVVGATDGLYLRAAGIPTYGVQGIFYDRNDIRFHGRDERVPIDSFYDGQKFLYEVVKQLSE
ncbi:MAG: M20/M25/M40 family metallo-hydrolase, partial [Acidobacteriales bacterium]|nr:M20/M25/M40 family metallo-hydrolase [Terriglobales bacterium]